MQRNFTFSHISEHFRSMEIKDRYASIGENNKKGSHHENRY